MPTPEQHAVLSASSAHRWLSCPPSARLAEQFPESTSPYAEAGRLAHAIGELKARKYFLEPMSTRAYNARMKKLQAEPSYDKSMEENTDIYLETLKETALAFESAPFVALETRVDFSDYVPDGFGTADCIMIGGGTIAIVDYKNGAGVPVEAEENPQMKLYALGALQVYAPIYGDTIQRAVLKIVQPNAGGVKSWETTVPELRAWAEDVVKPTAARAFAGEGDFSAGDWCRFCPARAQCSARARQLLALEPMAGAKPRELAEPGSTSPLLTDAEIGDVLRRAQTLAAWVAELKEYALSTSLAGREIPGFKAVAGKSSREWDNQDAAFQTLQERGVAEAVLWERKPCSVAELEKVLGKKAFKEIADDLVVKKSGKPALAPASDKRPVYNPAAAAFGGA